MFVCPTTAFRSQRQRFGASPYEGSGCPSLGQQRCQAAEPGLARCPQCPSGRSRCQEAGFLVPEGS